MSDDAGPGQDTTTQRYVGSEGPAVTEPDDAHPTRWTHVADREEFLDAARGLVPEWRDRPVDVGPAARGARAGLPRRAAAAVQPLDDDWTLVLTPTVSFTEDDRQVHTGELGCLVGPDTVVTFEEGAADVCARARERLDVGGGFHELGPSRVTMSIILSLVAAAGRVEAALGDTVVEMERLVFGRGVDDPVQEIYDLKREITEARRALLPVSAELPELADPDSVRNELVDDDALERVVGMVERIDRHLDAHDDLLSDMLQVHLAQVSVRQNEDMRKISAWAAILVYPTIVAGVYGMNFTNMPELHWAFGYPFAMGLMVVGCLVLYRVFRRVGWL